MYKLQELRERGLEVKRDVNGEPHCDKTGSRITVWSYFFKQIKAN